MMKVCPLVQNRGQKLNGRWTERKALLLFCSKVCSFCLILCSPFIIEPSSVLIPSRVGLHYLFFKKNYLFYFYVFWLHGVFVAARQLSLVTASRGYSSLWSTGSRAQAQQLWRTGLVAPRHVGSSRTRARTRVPCIGRRILNHCTTRGSPALPLNTLYIMSCVAH